MKIFILDAQNTGVAFALRCQEVGHSVRLYEPNRKGGEPCPIGDGLVEKVAAWQPPMAWADLIVITDNSVYGAELEPFFKRGLPILGSNLASAALELDRKVGMDALAHCGVDILPYKTFEDFDKAAAFLSSDGGSYVIKPWGGAADKSLSYVPPSAYALEAMLFKLALWKRQGLKGTVMLQQRVSGIEMGVSGWFGPGGWNEAIEEDWEEKEFMDGGLGPNTGEQGTTLRFVKRSKLFNEVLKPLTEYLHALEFVGNVNVNCMIDEEGRPWPLEFTMRLGWPAFNIMQPLIEGDPAEWMLDLLEGKDTLRMRKEVAVGVVLTHGDYPHCKQAKDLSCGFPFYGLSDANKPFIHLQSVMQGKAPMRVGGSVKDRPCVVTAGDYIAVITGNGPTVSAARKAAYAVVEEIKLPSNLQHRTDIGLWLKPELPKLHEFGYAIGLEF